MNPNTSENIPSVLTSTQRQAVICFSKVRRRVLSDSQLMIGQCVVLEFFLCKLPPLSGCHIRSSVETQANGFLSNVNHVQRSEQLPKCHCRCLALTVWLSSEIATECCRNYLFKITFHSLAMIDVTFSHCTSCHFTMNIRCERAAQHLFN